MVQIPAPWQIYYATFRDTCLFRWLVERRQLSCVFCFGGVGDSVIFTLRSNTLLLLRSSFLKCSVCTVGWAGVGRGRVGDNVMFTLCLTRFCCYALLFVKYSVGTVGWAGVGWDG